MNRIKASFFLLIFVFCFSETKSQVDYTWWNQVHHWDGYTSWLKYLTYSPQYFGPNALPVPEMEKGMVGSKGTFELAADGHFSKGDHTQDAFIKLYYPVVGKLIAIESYVVPLEHFKMDTITRDIRAARIQSGEGTAGGDIYFGTVIQFIKDRKFPDMAFRMMCRTASGTNVSAARYTDAPGYFLDISMGKDIKNDKNIFSIIRPYWMIGFYSWQTNLENYRQDDSFLYGAGLDISSEKIILSASVSGYFGYINNHDRPVVTKLNFLKKGKSFNYGISAQMGLSDYPYKSIRLSLVYNLPEKMMFLDKPGVKN